MKDANWHKIAAEAINDHHDVTHLPFKCRNGTANPPRQVFKLPLGTVRRTTSQSGDSQIKTANWCKIAAKTINNHHDATHSPFKWRHGTVSPPGQVFKVPLGIVH
ncbi:hypothetical protein JCGZ_04240 [Jatropha curcas]|uniref:Uncharacterized protein n=1 Tax=Jatropha curcas TaxID=180498 RepID=A0A067L5Q5_JATCU|nr:hypothetical protein JCGZ_04240 [Jatropha curcas]